MAEIETSLLIITAIISLGFLGNYLFSLTKISDAVWLLIVGLMVGPVASIYGYELAAEQILIDLLPFFLVVAIVMTLFEGGLGFNLNKMFRQVPEYIVMTLTLFVLSAASVVGLIFLSYNLVGIEFNLIPSLLLGTIIGGTTSAVVSKKLSAFRHADERTVMMLGLESIFNSPVTIMLALAMIPLVGAEVSSYPTLLADTLSVYALSAAIGAIAGVVWIKVMSIIKNQEYHYMLTLALIFTLYSIAWRLESNGYIIAFALGMVLGNSKRLMRLLRVRSAVDLTAEMRKFNSLISFFIKTFFLIFLGTLVTFQNPQLFVLGIGISLAFLVIRYFVVKIASPAIGVDAKNRHMMTYLYPRGLTPAVLAVMMYSLDVPGAQSFVEIVFAVIVTTTMLSSIGTFLMDRKH